MHISGMNNDFLWAALLVTIAPFRSLMLWIYGLFRGKPRRSMNGEIVLVTGAAQGLGRGTSIEFARLGATVVCWDIQEEGCLETVRMAKDASGGKAKVHHYICDISKRDEVIDVARRVEKDVGNVTILINNAAIVTANRLDRYKPQEIVRVVNTNFTSHFWMIEAFLPYMKSVNSGQLVCISSMSSMTPIEYLVPYAATKCAITGLMDALDEELISMGYDNIKVTTIHPFFAATSTIVDALKNSEQKNGRTENRPDAMSPSSVVEDLVAGVLDEKREFSIPSHLMGLTKFIKLYPRDVVRACRQVYTKNWKDLFAEDGEVVTK